MILPPILGVGGLPKSLHEILGLPQNIYQKPWWLFRVQKRYVILVWGPPKKKLIPGGPAEDIFFAKEPSSAKMRGAPGSFTLSTPDLLKKRASATALPTSFSPDVLLSSQDFLLVHPRKSTWNLKMKIIFQTSIFGFRVSFQGCSHGEEWQIL